MTVCGIIAGREHLVAWADTRVDYRSGRVEHRSKLAINGLAGTVGTGTGWLSLAEAGHAAVLAGADFDAIVPAVMRALRRASSTVMPQVHPEDRCTFCLNSYGVGGWSASAGRFLVVELDAESFFEPRIVPASLRPRLPEAAPRHRLEVPEVLHLAARQAAVLGQPVGKLSVVTATPGGLLVLPPAEIPEIAPLLSPSASAAGVPCGQDEARCEARPGWAPGGPSTPTERLVPRAA